MARRKHRRKRRAEGIYEDRGALAAKIQVGEYQRERRFPLDTPLREIQAWRDQKALELRRLVPRSAAAGTFAAEIRTYLKTLENRPRLKLLRAKHLDWWANYRGEDGRRFGDRRRDTFQRVELHAALSVFASTPYVRWKHRPAQLPSAGTVRHYRTALFHLYSTLDGKDAPNPLREIPPAKSNDPEPRWIPYAVIEAIFDAMPDRGQGLRHQERSAVSKTKARLRAMAYTGLPSKQLSLLKPSDIGWDDSSVLVQGRKKGKGSKTVRLPLTPQGLDALRELFAANAGGTFSTSSVRSCWWRAIHTMVDRLALVDFRSARDLLFSLRKIGARPYDLRHSYLTEFYLATGNLKATQDAAMHRDRRMTERYTLAAVDPSLRAAAAQLGDRLPRRVPREGTGENRSSPDLLGK